MKRDKTPKAPKPQKVKKPPKAPKPRKEKKPKATRELTLKKRFRKICAALKRIFPRRAVLGALSIILVCGLLCGTLVLAVSAAMKDVTVGRVLSPDALSGEAFDCILVLGAGVREDGTASPMLEDRVKVACTAYEALGGVPIVMSGDHTGDYNEVAVMKALAVEAGVPAEDIFLDHEGYSTYESVYRAKHKFGAHRVLIVSQGYHLYRAIHIADSMGLDACGAPADLRDYYLQTRYELREILARLKDLYTAAKAPAYAVGEPIDLSGDGNLT